MAGLMRAEWLRLRKRRSLQVIVVAVPVLALFFFASGFGSIYEQPPFDAERFRQELIDSGYVEGLPPEEAEALLDQEVEFGRLNDEQSRESAAYQRTAYAFPASLVQILGYGTFALLALILLTATSIGDEFGWSTIRTSLLASSHRWQLLSVRLLGLVATAGLIFGSLLLLGAILPVLLGVSSYRLVPQPPFDAGALLVLLAGYLVAGVAALGFAALATLLVRSGALTLVAVLVYATAEIGVLLAMSRFPEFQAEGELAWLQTLLPVRGLTEITSVAGRAATGLASYPGELVPRNLEPAILPLVSIAIAGVVFIGLAYRRFGRMDIVE
jgi:ABC-type transport system involved in multi-copper enzyme maturation permease subunit